MDKVERDCWIALAIQPGIGAGLHKALVARFGSARAAWEAPGGALAATPGVGEKRLSAIQTARGSDPLGAAERLAAWAEDGPWQVICLSQQEYPAPLREIYDPPAAIWVRGAITDGPTVAIVGSRRATAYGLRVAREFAEDLAAAGVTVVSGLARGIDTAGHTGALAAGGSTVAVLGSGIDRIYPEENARLHEEIARRGALVSEFPPGFEPLPGNFPARNRVISGLSVVTVVVEAGERSGALITADMALEQGREVMVVPGNITSLASAGCNRLIAEGAKPLLTSADILGALAIPVRSSGQTAVGDGAQASADDEPAASATGDPRQDRVLLAITDGVATIDEIMAATGLTPSESLAALTALQIRGRVETLPGGRFVSFSRHRK